MEMRKNGQLTEGVSIDDMGKKTIGNDLDNASIKLTNVVLPKEALLNRFGDVSISEKDTYIPPPKGLYIYIYIYICVCVCVFVCVCVLYAIC